MKLRTRLTFAFRSKEWPLQTDWAEVSAFYDGVELAETHEELARERYIEWLGNRLATVAVWVAQAKGAPVFVMTADVSRVEAEIEVVT